MVNRLEPGAGVREGKIIAIVRSANGTHLLPAVHRLADSGIRAIEVTTNTPGAADAVAALIERGVEAGFGTVRTVEHVRLAASTGASFVVTPATDLAVGAAAIEAGLRWYPGAMTPTEIETAWQAGATAVKLFPAAVAGGARFVREVRAPLDDVPLIPTGGVALDDIQSYLAAGAIALGIGSPLLGTAVDDGDLDALADRAARALAAVGAAQ